MEHRLNRYNNDFSFRESTAAERAFFCTLVYDLLKTKGVGHCGPNIV